MLAVTMPCGAPEQTRERRIRVLQRTCKRALPLLEQADHVVCLANFGDDETRLWLKMQPWASRVLFSDGRVTNPEATRLLLKTAIDDGADRVLHAEDDWYMMPDALDWLELAEEVLCLHSDVGQVRLRCVDDYHEEFNWVTGAPLKMRGYPLDGDRYRIGNLHATYNPSLWRREAILDSFPTEDFWRDEQRTMYWFDRAGWKGATLIPGVFIHRDDGASVEGVWR